MRLKDKVIGYYKRFLKQNNEYLITIISLVLFFGVMPFIRRLDPTSEGLDGGYLHALVFQLVCSGWVFGVAWLMYRLSFPKAQKHFDNVMEDSVLNSEETLELNRAIFTTSIWAFYVIINTLLLINII